ncbi:MAG TPA: dihydrodipicolinate synthase family protein [Candidatus Limnocylindria bacterium]|nr:dihydrodipicolinate synthase family protein [Candidatus Limnocylindria bacterium]
MAFEGILPALITPFTADGAAVDTAALDELVERCIAGGVSGLVTTGSTGEFTTLTADERREVTEAVLAAAAGRVPTIAGTGALSTAETVALSAHAEAAGAAAVMIVPPFYTPLPWHELVAHFAAVADRISIPIMYYNLPAASGITLTAERLAELKRVAGVTAFKDTGGDAIAATAFFQSGEDLPALLNGYDTLTFAALAAGVRGIVWGAASFIPGPCVELHRLLIEDLDLAAARSLWARIWPICDLLESGDYAAGVKAGCRHVGLSTGPVRAPLHDLPATDAARLAGLIDRALDPARRTADRPHV